MTKMIEIRELSKVYDHYTALDRIELTFEKDKIYGLLGKNGAGKTTLLKCISAQIFPTSGDIQVFGSNPYENTEILKNICFIKEGQKYPNNYSIQHALNVAESLFPHWDREFAEKLVQDFNLPIKKKIIKLSRGMHSAVGIIIGLASRAPITIFDEPYLGLDAVSRKIFYDRLMDDYTEYPRTIILSTHLIDEVSNLLEHVIVINNGQMIINQDAEELRGAAFTVTGPSSLVTDYLKGKETIHREAFGGLLSATILGTDNGNEQTSAKMSGLEISPVSLQQLIVHLTNQNAKGVTPL